MANTVLCVLNPALGCVSAAQLPVVPVLRVLHDAPVRVGVHAVAGAAAEVHGSEWEGFRTCHPQVPRLAGLHDLQLPGLLVRFRKAPLSGIHMKSCLADAWDST